MDLKFMDFKKGKMKFFTQISSSLFQYWAFRDDAQDILVPFHQLFTLYSMPHYQQPRNEVPNISVSIEETKFAEFVKFDPFTTLQIYSPSVMGNIQYVQLHEHGHCSQHPLKFELSHCYKSG